MTRGLSNESQESVSDCSPVSRLRRRPRTHRDVTKAAGHARGPSTENGRVSVFFAPFDEDIFRAHAAVVACASGRRKQSRLTLGVNPLP